MRVVTSCDSVYRVRMTQNTNSTTTPAVGDTIRFETWAGTSLVGKIYSVTTLTHTLIDGALYGVETNTGDCFDVRDFEVVHIVASAHAAA